MFSFSGKVIIIVSPNKWGRMKLSKHHYAVELAKKGNKVFFIEPPDISLNKKINVVPEGTYPGLFIVSYKPVSRGQRFLPSFVFKKLLKFQVALLLKALDAKPDVVISFDPFRFENLKWFGADYAIYFASDLHQPKLLPGEVTSADFCLGVSPTIVALLKKNNPAAYFIHHGLNSEFETFGREKLADEKLPSKKDIIIGYIGNLLMGAPDRFMMKKIISEHPELKFIFWGQYEKKQDHMVAHKERSVADFIEFLESSRNVVLRGPKSQAELVKEIEQVDAFWICYDLRKSWLWDGSNSHKILEYLATGKPVIAHHIATYKDSDLLYMMENNDNDAFPALFSGVIDKIKNRGDSHLKNKRIQFALSNTYKSQIAFIESKINEVDSHSITSVL